MPWVRGSTTTFRWPAAAGADEDGGVLGEMTVGVTVAEGVAVAVVAVGVAGVGETVGVVVAVGVTVGVVVGVGVTVGVVVAVGVAVGVDVEVADGVGAGVVAAGDWSGPTRLGPVMWRPVSISAIASAATATTAITPPVAMPAANAWRSR